MPDKKKSPATGRDFSKAIREGLKNADDTRRGDTQEVHRLVEGFKAGKSAPEHMDFDLEEDKLRKGIKKY